MMNNKLRLLVLIIGLFLCGTTIVFSQSDATKTAVKPKPSPTAASPEKAKADAAWRKVGTITSGEPINGVGTYDDAVKKWGDDSPEYWRWWASHLLQYREEGLKFWREFPNDPRRYVWLCETVWAPIFYWKDMEQAIHSKPPAGAPADEAARKAWDDQYIVLRAELMADPKADDWYRVHLKAVELVRDIEKAAKLSDGPARKMLLAQLAGRFLDLAPSPLFNENTLTTAGNSLLDAIGDDRGTEKSVIEAMKLSPRTELQLFGYGRGQVAALRDTPMELRAAKFDGTEMDIAKLRGKVVLVDVWSNWCTGCIAAMPKVRAVYDKYRDKGFEVVGVWLSPLSDDGIKEKPQAIKIMNEKGVNWPMVEMADKAMVEFEKRYSIIGVPVTFLLGKDGKLVTNNVQGDRLENEVKQLLGL